MRFLCRRSRIARKKKEFLKLNTLVIEQTEHGDMPVDVYQKLASDRILFLCNHITDDVATDIVATLLLKDAEDCEKKITLFINSDGGDIRNALMIYDVMTMIEAPIETVCIGSATDEAAIVLAGGTAGMRFATKNAIISIGQLVHDWYTQADLTDAKKILEQSTADNKRMMEIFSKATGKPVKQLTIELDRQIFLSAKEALKFGLIDKIVETNKK